MFDTATKNRIALTEQIESVGYNVEQHSIADKAVLTLRTNSSIAGAIVAVNSQLLHDTSLEFLHLLDQAQDRLVDIPIALIPSKEDSQVIESSCKQSRSRNGDDVIHLKRGISPALTKARTSNHVRVELRNPADVSDDLTNINVENFIVRYEEMTQREIKASAAYSQANQYDFNHKKQYLKMLEMRKYSSGHRALNKFVERPRELKKQCFLNWKSKMLEGRALKATNGHPQPHSSTQAQGATKKAGGMVRGRKQALFKRLKIKAKNVSAAKRIWQRSIASNITHDRLIKRTILPTWLPLQMRRLYLAPDTTTRDLHRAIKIFNRMVLRRSEVWPRACRAMAFCLVSDHFLLLVAIECANNYVW